MVSLLCVLDLSPTGRSPLEVTQRRLVLSGCGPIHIIPSFVHVAPVRSRGEFCTLTSRLSEITLARFQECDKGPIEVDMYNNQSIVKKKKMCK